MAERAAKILAKTVFQSLDEDFFFSLRSASLSLWRKRTAKMQDGFRDVKPLRQNFSKSRGTSSFSCLRNNVVSAEKNYAELVTTPPKAVLSYR